MPHQCLKCGSIFEEGSPELLKGCPKCKGNRFFFTKTPLDEDQRKKIQEEMGKDLNEQIIELLGKDGSNLIDSAGNWVTMHPKDVRKVLKNHLPEQNKKLSFSTQTSDEMDLLEDDAYRKERIAQLLNQKIPVERPETINIQIPGKYAIDVKGLLENEPIIIQKDGSYTIHLPSVFKMVELEKEKK